MKSKHIFSIIAWFKNMYHDDIDRRPFIKTKSQILYRESECQSNYSSSPILVMEFQDIVEEIITIIYNVKRQWLLKRVNSHANSETKIPWNWTRQTNTWEEWNRCHYDHETDHNTNRLFSHPELCDQTGCLHTHRYTESFLKKIHTATAAKTLSNLPKIIL